LMKKSLLLKTTILTLSLFLLEGCTGTELLPNDATQTGASTGAITGAVLGYNTKGHHKGTRAAIGSVLGAVTGGLIGQAVDNNNPQPTQTGGWE